MNRSLLAAALIALPLSCFALELKGHVIGSTRAELNTHGWTCTKPERPIADEMCVQFGGTIGGTALKTLSLLYFEHRLLAISASLPVTGFPQLADALTEKFGSAMTEEHAVQNAFGARARSTLMRWSRPDGTIELIERVRMDSSSLTLSSPEYKQKLRARSLGDAEDL